MTCFSDVGNFARLFFFFPRRDSSCAAANATFVAWASRAREDTGCFFSWLVVGRRLCVKEVRGVCCRGEDAGSAAADLDRIRSLRRRNATAAADMVFARGICAPLRSAHTVLR